MPKTPSASKPGALTQCLGLAGLLVLAGCGAMDAAQEALAPASAASKFGTATRERLSAEGQGTTLRMMISATAPASWLQADEAMYRQLDYQCRDGASHSIISESPQSVAGGKAVSDKVHPAGTTFIRVIRCSPPPDFEFAVASGTPRADAEKQVRARLGQEATDERDGRFITVVPFNSRNRKYPAIAAALGKHLAARMTQCPGGLRVERMVIAAHPQPESSFRRALDPSYVVLGVDAPCQAADTAAVAP